MVLDDKIQGIQGISSDPSRISGAVPAGQGFPEVRGADFSRILEELMQSAGKLDAQAVQAPAENPQALKDAVAEAKQSLDTAMSLSETLLEAYRRTLVTDPNREK